MKLKKLAAVLGLGLVSAAAQAGYTQLWEFQDDSIDFILRDDGQGNLIKVTDGLAQQGDIFVGIFEMPTVSAKPPGVSLIPPGKEITGVSVVQLVSPNPGTTSPWVFSAYTGGMNSILALAGHPGVIGGNPGGGAVTAMWINGTTNGTNPYLNPPTNTIPNVDRDLRLDAADPVWGTTTNCVSLEDCLKEASLGDLFQVDGLWGANPKDRSDADNFWVAFPVGAGANFTAVRNGAPNTPFGLFFAGLSNLFNIVEPVLFKDIISGLECPGAGYSITPDNCVQVTVSGNILGGRGLVNGAVARDDIDAEKLVRVPEPATLGLLGLGLLGLSLMRRRQA